MYKLFARYASVGVLNTAIHWSIFFAVHSIGVSQALSNVAAFFLAVTFSFIVNAKYTFKGKATSKRYITYLIFMGFMAGIIGQISDYMHFSSFITLIVFSAVSLVMGFFYSKYIVFREIK